MFIKGQMDKENMIHTPHTDNEILSSHKKKEILLFVTTWMDFEGIMLNELSQTERDKYCMWNLRTLHP